MRDLDVALATCRRLPEADPDEEPLLRALAEAGLRAASLAWDDPDAGFRRARATVLRATWNYPESPTAFLRWAACTAEVSRLWNPLEVVRWNLHKSYLLDLEARGVPVVPTRLVRKGETPRLDAIARDIGSADLVVKPAIGAASRATLRGSVDDPRLRAHLERLLCSEDVLVQPYIRSVEAHGERAIVRIDGRITHAVRKSPRFAGEAEQVSAAVPVSAAERAVAEAAVACAPGPLLYARIDVAPGPDGTPVVMELELIEPSLFFCAGGEETARLMARAIAARL